MPDRYGDRDDQPPPYGARLDAWGMPPCDSSHPDCCAQTDRYRTHNVDRRTPAQNAQEARK